MILTNYIITKVPKISPFPPRLTTLISVLAGIGTYGINETSANKSWFGEMRSSISQTIDQGIGTTFDAHVMAGYRFLMRYYDTVRKSSCAMVLSILTCNV